VNFYTKEEKFLLLHSNYSRCGNLSICHIIELKWKSTINRNM